MDQPITNTIAKACWMEGDLRAMARVGFGLEHADLRERFAAYRRVPK